MKSHKKETLIKFVTCYIENTYEKNTQSGIVKKPASYTLYHMWKEMDAIESLRNDIDTSCCYAGFDGTVETVPVVHANWIKYNDDLYVAEVIHDYECGNCGRREYTNYDYCPHCGAKMDKLDNPKSNLDKDGDNNATN